MSLPAGKRYQVAGEEAMAKSLAAEVAGMRRVGVADGQQRFGKLYQGVKSLAD